MSDPVFTVDGHSFERLCIEEWLCDHTTSPVTRELLSQTDLLPNHALRNAIEEYFDQIFDSKRHAIKQVTGALFAEQGTFGPTDAVRAAVTGLFECLVMANADTSQDILLRRMLREARVLLGAEVSSVFMIDKSRKELVSTMNSTGKEIRIPLNSGVAGQVVQSGTSAIIHDAYADPHFNQQVDAMTGFKTSSIMCVPIRARSDGTIGVAELVNKESHGIFATDEFGLDDLRFLELIVEQAAAAIVSNGRFFHCLDDPLRPAVVRDRAPTTVTVPQAPAPAPAPTADYQRVLPVLKMAFKSFDFDVLTLQELTHGKALSVLTFYLMEQNGLISCFNLDQLKLKQFLAKIEAGYDDSIGYHNSQHVASVVHAAHIIFQDGGVAEAASKAADVETSRAKFVLLALLLSAAIHDFEHRGLSNSFLEITLDERAVRYNGKSTNEQHHAAAAFSELLKPECNFLEAMPSDQFMQLRWLIIEMVLATDMVHHDSLVKNFTTLDRSLPSSAEDAVLVLKMVLKCADIGHVLYDWGLHMRWVYRLQEEFFHEGDEEKRRGLPVSFLKDRQGHGIAHVQAGFLKSTVLPMVQALADAFPSCIFLVNKAVANLQKWSDADRTSETG